MLARLLLWIIVACGAAIPSQSSSVKLELIVVVGAPGENVFEAEFTAAADPWIKAAAETKRPALLIDASSGTNQLGVLTNALASQHGQADSELWLILIGHGTFDGKEAKFNLQGPDLAADYLAELLAPVQRPLIIINTASASAPFLNKLSRENRIVITATKSGYEENYARFGKYMARAVTEASADIDKDGQTSLLEAFLMASREVEEFYKNEGRLATEHALIDDNGDGFGTPAIFFKGVRATKKPQENAGLDGLRAHQVHLIAKAEDAKLPAAVLKRRNELELQLEQLRARRPDMEEEAYLAALEKILIELSRVYVPQQETAKPATPE